MELFGPCWEWQGFVGSNGYGQLSFHGQKLKPHRIAYEMFWGPIPEGLEIDHLCRNRACYNPRHLEAVTPKENVRKRNRRHWYPAHFD